MKAGIRDIEAVMRREVQSEPKFEEIKGNVVGWVSHDGRLCAVVLGPKGIEAWPVDDTMSISWITDKDAP